MPIANRLYIGGCTRFLFLIFFPKHWSFYIFFCGPQDSSSNFFSQNLEFFEYMWNLVGDRVSLPTEPLPSVQYQNSQKSYGVQASRPSSLKYTNFTNLLSVEGVGVQSAKYQINLHVKSFFDYYSIEINKKVALAWKNARHFNFRLSS